MRGPVINGEEHLPSHYIKNRYGIPEPTIRTAIYRGVIKGVIFDGHAYIPRRIVNLLIKSYNPGNGIKPHESLKA